MKDDKITVTGDDLCQHLSDLLCSLTREMTDVKAHMAACACFFCLVISTTD